MFKRKNGTFKVLTLIGLFGFIGLLIPSNVFAKAAFKEGYCNSCEPPGSGVYAFYYVDGKEVTTFYPDDDSDPTTKGGHGTFVTGNGNDSTYYDKELFAKTEISISNNVISIEAEDSVEITIVDVSTSDFVTDFIKVPNHKEIDISHLPIGCKYNLIVWQEVEPGVILPIKSHLFCKE